MIPRKIMNAMIICLELKLLKKQRHYAFAKQNNNSSHH